MKVSANINHSKITSISLKKLTKMTFKVYYSRGLWSTSNVYNILEKFKVKLNFNNNNNQKS